MERLAIFVRKVDSQWSGVNQAQATGNGAVATTTLTTVENEWFGIPAGLTLNVTWVYVEQHDTSLLA